VEKLGLTGLSGMVARHGELASFANGNFELVVPETHRMYAEKAYQDKLKADLQKHFGLRRTAHGARGQHQWHETLAAAHSRDPPRRSRRMPPRRSRTIPSCATWCATWAPRS
jgi:hypothetical protein